MDETEWNRAFSARDSEFEIQAELFARLRWLDNCVIRGEVRYRTEGRTCIFDIAVFSRQGIPLAVVEVKNARDPEKYVANGYGQNQVGRYLQCGVTVLTCLSREQIPATLKAVKDLLSNSSSIEIRRGRAHAQCAPPAPDATGTPPPPTRTHKSKQLKLIQSESFVTPSIQEVVDKWNGHFSLTRIHTIGTKSNLIQTALTNPFWRENWIDGIIKLVKTPFCMGKNRREWKADITWFCNPENLEKLLNGKYDNISSQNEQATDYERKEI